MELSSEYSNLIQPFFFFWLGGHERWLGLGRKQINLIVSCVFENSGIFAD